MRGRVILRDPAGRANTVDTETWTQGHGGHGEVDTGTRGREQRDILENGAWTEGQGDMVAMK